MKRAFLTSLTATLVALSNYTSGLEPSSWRHSLQRLPPSGARRSVRCLIWQATGIRHVRYMARVGLFAKLSPDDIQSKTSPCWPRIQFTSVLFL